MRSMKRYIVAMMVCSALILAGCQQKSDYDKFKDDVKEELDNIGESLFDSLGE